ncbi:CAP domain-containing protein [Massilia sp. DWR3-1-1]|uniref:CAP domain-containing protein n=1 Tax=Massilia sp. DWR3-1-1 TaxID=2804559 RepID=UPI003CF7722E
MPLTARCHLVLPLLVLALLSACGGGGSTGSAPAATTSTTTTGSFDTSAYPAAPASVGNVAADGRNWINYRRSQLGVAALLQNAQVNQAAQNHSDYQRLNNTVTHDEESGKAGFTGVGLDARLASAGYQLSRTGFVYGEIISATSNTSGFFMAEELVTAIYHRFVMFEPVLKEIGTGLSTNASKYSYFTADLVASNGLGPGLGRGKLAVWPFNGQSAVVPNFFSDQEEPDPVAGIDEVGYPISVHADAGAIVLVSSFTVRPRNGGNLTVKLLQRTLDDKSPLTDLKTQRSTAAIIPLSRLAAATVYDVAFSGTVDGVPVSLSWSFTTR